MSVDWASLSTDGQHLFEAALELPEIERAKFADKLSLTLDPMANAEWQEAWGSEIARRIAEIENGTAKLVDWEDLRRELWERLDVARGSAEHCSSDEVDWEVLSAKAQPLFDAARRLTDADRAKLADRLYASIETEADQNIVAEATITRRLAETENGAAKLHTWDELQQMMQSARNATPKD